MRWFLSVLSAVITVALIVLLDKPVAMGNVKTPRLGYFLSPQKGFWQNAEADTKKFDGNIQSAYLQGKTDVYFDDRLVPHVYAEHETDAYFVQGYLHARFRLWQMEFQTHAAGGRLSEIMGASYAGTDFLSIDKFFRRLGMVYAAEQSLKVMEADEIIKPEIDAYTAGVNAYIASLDEGSLPLEYKLLDYKPESWTNLKTALFMKYMAYDLAGFEEDFEKTNAKHIFTKEQFKKLYPYGQDILDPVIAKGTPIAKSALVVKKPATADSLYFDFRKNDSIPVKVKLKPDPANGSNNWAVAGSKTKSGKPILCNDPHLGLNLPSIWYEMQISTPEFNAYGATFPGTPSVVIGFNDSCAFGFTNAERDVRDYYEITFRDTSMREYWFDSTWQPTTFRDEVIKIKGAPADTQHIAMTVWGPVMYDSRYEDALKDGKAYACRWKAHDASNELLTFNRLNRAKNFNDYTNAIATYQCPGQNMVFAAKNGDIAIRQQGQFPAKWRWQGDFAMPGSDSAYRWQSMIPDSMNITMLNPQRGFVSSANQYPYDTAYPYYLGGSYPPYRGFIINWKLANRQNFTAEDMQIMQTDNYNVFARLAKPVLTKYMDASQLSNSEKKLYDIFIAWNLRNDAAEKGASVFTAWYDSLMSVMYQDEFAQTQLPLPEPAQSSLLEGIGKDSLYEFADDIRTPQKETITDMVVLAFKKAAEVLQKANTGNSLAWGKFKDSGIRHLLRIPALSRLHLLAGGGVHIINAHKQYHGPSWRMVVHLTDETEAYGIYPGGQSGNPGSKYYDNFINDWVQGKYYRIKIVGQDVAAKEMVKGKIVFSKA
ncbi:penicillin acylase family protein [Foetidibacter luteolus]|uniref:penicillin acylase family protein n=1 Tax=Foetidibacter luteolus TaxID=2608880 RepID=UPI00129C089A|nr:penicillin acylase family protein [Foetidibacter luteolus]